MFQRTLARANHLTMRAEYFPVQRKPVAREETSGWVRSPNDATSLGHEYILRACELVREGKLDVVLVSGGHYWLGQRADPWGTKETISIEALRRRIDEIDGKVAKVA